MFTGIIEATAKVLERSDDAIVIERPKTFGDLKKGGSVSVSGACLTVVTMNKKSLTFDVVPETWKKTKLGSLKEGDRVNLERAMKANGRFDGHIVQGHVEGVGEVQSVTSESLLLLTLPTSLLPFILAKGSITIDGVALTVVSVKKNAVSVALIPETLRMTTLGNIKKGDTMNIETDILGKYVHSFLKRSR